MTHFNLRNLQGHLATRITADIVAVTETDTTTIGEIAMVNGRKITAAIFAPGTTNTRRLTLTAPAGYQFGFNDLSGVVVHMLNPTPARITDTRSDMVEHLLSADKIRNLDRELASLVQEIRADMGVAAGSEWAGRLDDIYDLVTDTTTEWIRK